MHFAQDTWWQSGVQSCIMAGLPTHLVQELNIGTIRVMNKRTYKLDSLPGCK